MYPNAGGEVVKDLVPIAPFLIWSHVIVVAPDIPAKTLSDLVAYAKANPGKLVWGYGLGSTPHILLDVIRKARLVSLRPVQILPQRRLDLEWQSRERHTDVSQSALRL